MKRYWVLWELLGCPKPEPEMRRCAVGSVLLSLTQAPKSLEFAVHGTC